MRCEIKTTTVEQVSDNGYAVDLVLSDSDDEDDQGSITVQLEVTVEFDRAPLLADLQATALRKVQDAIADQVQRLTARSGQRS